LRPVRPAAVAAFAIVACGALLASANAPPDQYLLFGPQDTEIHDYYTNLTWERSPLTPDASVAYMDHAAAVTNCNDLGKRLPSYRELLTLVDEDGHPEWDPSKGTSTLRYIDPNAFPGTPADNFWSMSPGQKTSTYKVVDFGSGETSDLDQTSSAYVRCVSDQ
jgi:hypothetical protein